MSNSVLVIDAMGIAHNILYELSTLAEVPAFEPYIRAQMQWLGSGIWYPDFSFEAPTVILCWDSKPYWRSEYLLRDDVWQRIHPVKRRKVQPSSPIHYKGGRSKPPAILEAIKGMMRQAATDNGWHNLKRMATDTHGYEADDLAALTVQVNRVNTLGKHIYLVTRDKDWMGLIGTDVTWICCNNDNPRVRNIDNWQNSFKGVNLVNPTDIWKYKAQTGDSSDNLPNCGGCLESYGALLPVIDLFRPVDQYNLLKDPTAVKEAMLALITETPPAKYIDRAVKALVSKGLKPCIPRYWR